MTSLASTTKPMNNGMKYAVRFVSPYFALYIKEPSRNHWHLARAQQAPVPINITGAPQQKVHPVLLFTSATEAEEYSQQILGITDAYKPRKEGFFDFIGTLFNWWKEPMVIEELREPNEYVDIMSRTEVKPVIHSGNVVQLHSKQG